MIVALRIVAALMMAAVLPMLPPPSCIVGVPYHCDHPRAVA